MFRRHHVLINAIISFLLFCFAVFYITYPLIFHLGDRVTGYGDELVIAWIQNWVIHIFVSGNFFHLFDANLYYPFHNSFAYSDTFVTSSIVSLIPLLIFKQPIVVVNFTLIISLLFLGFSLYLVCFYLTKDFFASLFAGFLVIFSPAMLDKVVHLQIVAIVGVPLAILFFLLFLDKQKTKFLVFSLLCFVLQTYNSFIPGYFIVFSYAIIISFYGFYQRGKMKTLVTAKHITFCIISLLLVIPIAVPYYQVSHEFHYVRDIRETIHFALQPEDFITTGNYSLLQPVLKNIPFIVQTSMYGEVKPGFIGGVFSLLAIAAFYYFFKTFKRIDVYTKIFSTIALTGLLLSLGPFLHINRQTIHKPFPIPLPYSLLYYLVPGFKGIRDSERWEVLFMLGIAIVIAILLHEVLHRYAFKIRIVIYSLLFLGVVGEFSFPMHLGNVPQINQFPKVYAWLATTPKDTKIIFMPIYNWDKSAYIGQEIWREYYATIEFRPMVNGYSGFSPPPWQILVNDLYRNFPQGDSITTIQKLGISYIIVDKNAYDTLVHDKQRKTNGSFVLKTLASSEKVVFVKQFANEYVFSIKR